MKKWFNYKIPGQCEAICIRLLTYSLMESALPFDYVEFDRSVETTGDVSNMTAEEYLSWVRYQADMLPHVKRVDIDSIQLKNTLSCNMPRMEEVSSCPVELLPNEEWQNDVIFKFSELRLKLDSRSQDIVTKERKLATPAMKDEQSWLRFCLESECNSGSNSDDKHNLPLTSNDNECTSLSIVASHERGLNGGDSIALASLDDDEVAKRILKRKRNLASTLGISLSTTSSGKDINDVYSGVVAGDFDNDGDNDDKDKDKATEINFSRNIDRENEDDDEEEDDDDDIEDTIRAAVNQAETERILSEQWNQPINVTPTADVLLQFDQVLTQKLIHYHINWLEEAELLTTARATWIYGLLARLEKPLYRETVACIRQLYRRCCYLRSHLTSSLMQVMDHQANLARLNTIISISGCYFGQGEEYMKSVLAQDELNNGVSNRFDDVDSDEEDNDTYMDACSDDMVEDELDDGCADENEDELMTIDCELEDGEEIEAKDAITENQSVKKKRPNKDFSL